MAENNYGFNPDIPPDIAAEALALQRRQKINEALLARSMEPLQGQMAGRFFVPPSPVQGLANLFGTYAAGRGLDKGDEALAALGTKYQAGQNKVSNAFFERMFGAASQPQAQPGIQPGTHGESQPVVSVSDVQDQPSPTPTSRDKKAAILALLGNPYANEATKKVAATLLGNLTKPSNIKLGDEVVLMEGSDEIGRMPIGVSPNTIYKAAHPTPTQGRSPYFTPIYTPNGIYGYDNRTNRLSGPLMPEQVERLFPQPDTAPTSPVPQSSTVNLPPNVGLPGQTPLLRTSDDPMLQGRIALEKAAGKATGETTTKAAFDLPKVIDMGDRMIKQIDELISHPGFKSSVGFTLLPGVRFIEGSPQAGFMKRLEQLKGGAFLQAFESLRGGGAITEIESAQGVAALNRMDKATSEREFLSAAEDAKAIIGMGIARAKEKANFGSPMSAQEAPSVQNELSDEDYFQNFMKKK